jgi:YD repeat-containing protein
MVAIVSGNGLGLGNTSAGLLGQQGVIGNPALGNSKESVYVNAANGNLVISENDIFLPDSGINNILTMTYNSRATLSGSANDWQANYSRHIVGQASTTNGSTVSRVDGDGSISVFTYDSTKGYYVSTDGGGSYQALSYSAGTWTWRPDGGDSNSQYEQYDASGLITGSGDQSGVKLSYAYVMHLPNTQKLLSSISDNAGNAIYFQTNSSGKISGATIQSGGNTLATYAYDSANRLSSVSIDLTPDDTSDTTAYTTTYTYAPDLANGTPSQLITGITQSDGTREGFTYDDSGRVTSYTAYADPSDLVGRSTTITYGNVDANTGIQTTTISDPYGNQTVLSNNSSAQLLSVQTPAANGLTGITSYVYDSNGNVSSRTDARGLRTTYAYDDHGNCIIERNAAGDTITRTYIPNSNKLLTETTTPATGWAAALPQTTNYVYDAFDRLRYVVSPEGRVTAYLYPDAGKATQVEYSSMLQYTAGFYPVPTSSNTAIALSALDSWVSNQAYTRTDYTYSRGLLSTSTTINSDGATPTSSNSYTYNAFGQLITARDANGNATIFTYDGLGRQLSKTVKDRSGTTLSSTSTTYFDSNRLVYVLENNQSYSAYAYDGFGNLIATTKGFSDSTYFGRDLDGRIRMEVSTDGSVSCMLYDAAGRKTADIDPAGAMTEYVYDASGQLIETTRYAIPVTDLAPLYGEDANGKFPDVSVDAIRPPTSPSDRSTWNFYDSANNLVDSVDALGYVTHFVYDGAGRLEQTIARTNQTDVAWLKTLTPAQLQQMPGIGQNPSADDRSTRNIYDRDGLLVGTIDPLGYLTEYRYNAAGLLTSTIAYASLTDNATRATGSLSALRPTATGSDLAQYRVYDAQNRLVGTVDGDGYLTELTYDLVGNVRMRTRYALPSTTPWANTLAGIKANIGSTQGSAVDNRNTEYTYDGLGRMLTEATTDGNGRVIGNSLTYGYDANGNLISRQAVNGTGYSAVYDSLGNLLSETQGNAAGSTTYEYSRERLRTSKTDPNGNITYYFYDAEDRLVYTVDPLGNVEQRTYDTFGELASTRSYTTPVDTTGLIGGKYLEQITGQLKSDAANDHASSYFYDADGRLTHTIDAAGAVDTYQFNRFGDTVAHGHYLYALDPSITLAYAGGSDVGFSQLIKSAEKQSLTVSPETIGQQTVYQYDADGRLVFDADMLGDAEGKSYDAFGRLSSTTRYAKTSLSGAPAASAGDAVTNYNYDGRGLVTGYTDAQGSHIATTYDGFGEAIQQARRATVYSDVYSSADSITRTVYDEDGQVAATIDATGALTSYQYNGDGRLTDQISYTVLLSNENLRAIDAQLSTGVSSNGASVAAALVAMAAPGSRDAHKKFAYDSQGRLVMTATANTGAGPNWSITTQSYDNNGNVVERIAYATASDDSDKIPATSDADAHVRYVYDADGRLTDTLTAQSRGVWSLSSQQLDAFGNTVQTTRYATAISSTSPSLADIQATKSNPSSGDVVAIYRYDSANRVTLSTIAQKIGDWNSVQWGFTSYNYDGAGNLSSKTAFANPVTTSGPAPTPSDLPAADSAHDRTTVYAYDAANRLMSTTDAAGGITELRYDTRGNVIATIQKGTPADRVSRTVYDLNNRPVYQIDAAGDVVQFVYDALGNLVTEKTYGTPIKLDQLDASAGNLGQLLTSADTDRTEHYMYDPNGHLRFTIDAGGYLTENQRDALGRIIATLAYPDPVKSSDFNGDYTANNAATVAESLGNARIATFQYDANSRLIGKHDAMGFGEFYGYDALGNKISYTNSLNFSWTYTYDALGHVLTETAPPVDVFFNDDDPSSKGISTSLVTRYSYDVFGDLKSKTEATGVVNADGTSQERTSEYSYDLLGRQTSTATATMTAYWGGDPATMNRQDWSGWVLIVNVNYDMFGDAVSNTDVGGNTSYKVYDQLGQVKYDVDALGYVTGYQRNAFGDVVTLTRYDHALSSPFSTDADTIQRQVSQGSSRSISTTYDSLGRAVKVMEPTVQVFDQQSQQSYLSAHTLDTTYNAFGEVIRQSSYGTRTDSSTTPEAVTHFYYDQLGHKVAQVSALSDTAGSQSGYLTDYSYDAYGNETGVTEFANAIGWWDNANHGAAIADVRDRQLVDQFDADNRRTLETRVGAQAATATTAASDIITRYGYDAAGNQTLVVDPSGYSTFTYYDALGRVVAVAQGSASTANTMQESVFKLNAYGNTIIRIDYAAGVPTTLTAALGTSAGVFATPESTDADRVTQMTYDTRGNELQVVDAQKQATYMSYDLFGRIARQWSGVYNNLGASGVFEVNFRLNKYDALGRLSTILTPGNVNVLDPNKASPDPTVQTYIYNAYGEAIQHITVSNGVQQFEYTDYDAAGRAWRTNAGDGIDKITIYDAQGNATVQVRSDSASDPHVLQSFQDASGALNSADVERVDTRYDLLGHVVDVSPMHGNQLSFLQYTFGTWIKQTVQPTDKNVDGLVVIGEQSEQNSVFSVSYRLQGTNSWITSPTRVTVVGGYPVFSTAGMTSGNYEFKITVQPPGEAAYERDGGLLGISSAITPNKVNELIGLYLMILGRAPDPNGLNYWLGRANSGSTMAQIATEMLNQTLANPSNLVHLNTSSSAYDVIKEIYVNTFKLDANDPNIQTEIAGWAEQYGKTSAAMPDNRGQILAFLAEAKRSWMGKPIDALRNYIVDQGGTDSETAAKLIVDSRNFADGAIAEGTAAATQEKQAQQLARAYIAAFGRAPDPTGFSFWLNAIKGGETVAQVAQEMLKSNEGQLYLPEAGQTSAQYNQQLVIRAYNNLLGRKPSADELAAWSGKLNSGSISHGDFIVQVTNQISTYIGGDAGAIADRSNLFNKLVISLAYVSMPPVSSDPTVQVAVAQVIFGGISPNESVTAAAASAMLYVQAQTVAAPGYATSAKVADGASPEESAQVELTRMYYAILGRAPDYMGLQFWIQGLKNNPNGGLESFVNATFGGEGSANYPPGMSDSDYVKQVYNIAFGTVPDAATVQKWTAELATASRGKVAIDIVNDMLANRDASTKLTRDLFNNRVGVGMTYALNTRGNDVTEATKVMQGVVVKNGQVDITAAIAEIAKVAQTASAAANLAVAQAASNTANLTAGAIKAAQDLITASAAAQTAAGQANPIAMAALHAAQLYAAILNRTNTNTSGLDLDGFANMIQLIQSGASDVSIIQQMLDSTEGTGLYPAANFTPAGFVTQFLTQLMGAAPDAATVARWTAGFTSSSQRATVANNILKDFLTAPVLDNSAATQAKLAGENAFDTRVAAILQVLKTQADQVSVAAGAALQAATTSAILSTTSNTATTAVTQAIGAAANTNEKATLDIARLYTGILDRGAPGQQPIDFAGFNFWVNGYLNALSQGNTRAQALSNIAQQMVTSTDGQKIFGTQPAGQAFVDKLYVQILNRHLLAGDTYWTGNLQGGGYTLGDIASGIILDVTETTQQVPSELNSAAWFDQRVVDTVTAFANDGKTTTGIANAAALVTTDSTNESVAYQNYLNAQAAYKTAQGLTAATFSTVVAAQAGKDYQASTYVTDLTTMLLGFNMPSDYATVSKDLADLAAGRTTLIEILRKVTPSISNLTTFFTSLYRTILNRAPDADGINWWISHTTSTDNAYVAYQFFLGCKDELNNTNLTAAQSASRGRTTFPNDLNNLLSLNNSKASTAASNYTKAVSDANTSIKNQQAAALAQLGNMSTAYNDSVTTFQNDSALNSTAQTLKTSLAATITVATKQVAAAQAMSASKTASIAADSALATLNSLSKVTVTAAQLAAYNTKTQAADGAIPADINLSSALANVASASIGMAAASANLALIDTTSPQVIQIAQIYTLILGRAPSADQVNSAVQQLASGKSLADIAAAIIVANPGVYPAGLSNNDFVQHLYVNFRNKDVSNQDSGVLFWAGSLGTSITPADRGRVVLALIRSLTVENINADTTSFNTRVQNNLNTVSATQQVVQATELYTLVMARAPSPAEVNAVMLSFQDGESLSNVAADLMASNPARFPAGMSDVDFVQKLYTGFRDQQNSADTTGPAFWVQSLQNRTRPDMVTDLIRSLSQVSVNLDSIAFMGKVRTNLSTVGAAAQNAANTPDVKAFLSGIAMLLKNQANALDASAVAALTPSAQYTTQITQLYYTLLGRTPEPGGLMWYLTQMANGTSELDIANSILNSNEAQFRMPSTLGNGDFVTAFFTQGLGRAPDATELATLTTQLNSGQLSRAQMVINAIADTYAYTGGDPARLDARNVFLGGMDTALDGVAEEMTGYSAALGSGFATSLQVKLKAALLRYVDGIQPGIDSTTVTTSQADNAANALKVDRWGDVLSKADAVDPNRVTYYTYNDAGQRTGTSEQVGNQTIATSVGYDKLGNVASTTDANGNVTTYEYDSNSALVKETHADGGVVTYVNDAFGEHRTVIQSLSNNSYTAPAGSTQNVVTNYDYDHLGHVTKVTSAVVDMYYAPDLGGTGQPPDMNLLKLSGQWQMVTSYVYDELGRRITTTQSVYSPDSNQTYGKVEANGDVFNYGVVDAAGNLIKDQNATTTTHVRYDLSGNIVSTIDALGFESDTVYDGLNHKILSRDANGGVMGWTLNTDGFGQVKSHIDLGGHTTTYSYDAAGEVTQQVTVDAGNNKIGSLTYRYEYGTGRIAEINDQVLSQLTTYTYDADGNRLSEKIWLSGTQRAVQDNSLRYDAFGRLVEVKSNIATAGADYDQQYEYDNNGNRLKETTTYTNEYGGLRTILLNNGFDAMNRQTSVNGYVVTVYPAPVQAKQLRLVDDPGSDNPDPDAPIDTSIGFFHVGDSDIDQHNIVYDAAGNRVRDTETDTHGAVTAVNTYSYDAAGRLTDVRDMTGKLISQRLYDGASRVIKSLDNKEIQVNAYDADGRLLRTRFATDSDNYDYDIFYGAKDGNIGQGGYDKMGNLLKYSVLKGIKDQDQQFFTNTYGTSGMFDTYQVTATGATQHQGGPTVTVHEYYDGNGHLASVDGVDARFLISDSAGRILEKTDASGLITHTLIANDHVIGSSNKDAETFSSSENGISARDMANSPSTYIVQSNGETLQDIAQAVWGDSRLWYLIADANGGIANTGLTAGQPLLLPTRANTALNGAQTFQPYNQADAVGKTTPSLPLPADGGGGGGCGTLGKIIVVAIAIAVTVYTAGVAAEALAGAGSATASGGALSAAAGLATGTTGLSTGAAIAAGAIGGAVGSLASQAVGIAIGVQDGFSWQAAALSAIGGGASAGIAGLSDSGGIFSGIGGSQPANIAARALVSNAASQGAGILTGLQSSFSWKNVAISYASAYGAAAVSDSMLTAMKDPNSAVNAIFGQTNDLAVRTVSGVAAGVTASVLNGGHINVTQIATDAFGNALGSSLADAISRPSLPDSMSDLPSDQRREIQNLAMRTGADLSDPSMADRIQKISELKFAAGQDLSRDDVLGRTSDFLRLRGATDDQISQVGDIYANNKVLPLVGNVEARWNTEQSDDDTTTMQRTFVGKYVDNAMVGTGQVLSKFGEYVESNPIAKYALEGLDIVTGPATYALRNFTPVGDIINAAQSKVTSYIAGGLEGVGRTDIDAQNGGIGGMAMLSVGGSGFAGAYKGIRSAIAEFRTGEHAASAAAHGIFVETGSGSTHYGPLDQLQRPTGINASITEDMLKTGTRPSSSISPPGWAGDGNKYNQARGHLLGNQLGGSGDIAGNLVTLQQDWVNSPVMRGYEWQVRSAVAAGETIQYSATPIYNGNNLIPRGVTLIGNGNNGFNLGVTVLNPIGF